MGLSPQIDKGRGHTEHLQCLLTPYSAHTSKGPSYWSGKRSVVQPVKMLLLRMSAGDVGHTRYSPARIYGVVYTYINARIPTECSIARPSILGPNSIVLLSHPLNTLSGYVILHFLSSKVVTAHTYKSPRHCHLTFRYYHVG